MTYTTKNAEVKLVEGPDLGLTLTFKTREDLAWFNQIVEAINEEGLVEVLDVDPKTARDVQAGLVYPLAYATQELLEETR